MRERDALDFRNLKGRERFRNTKHIINRVMEMAEKQRLKEQKEMQEEYDDYGYYKD